MVFSLLQVMLTCFVPVLALVMRTCVCVVLSKNAGFVVFSRVKLHVLAGCIFPRS